MSHDNTATDRIAREAAFRKRQHRDKLIAEAEHILRTTDINTKQWASLAVRMADFVEAVTAAEKQKSEKLEAKLLKAMECVWHYADYKTWQTTDSRCGSNFYVGSGDDGFELARRVDTEIESLDATPDSTVTHRAGDLPPVDGCETDEGVNIDDHDAPPRFPDGTRVHDTKYNETFEYNHARDWAIGSRLIDATTDTEGE